jgi:hypothetical protein
MADGRRDRCNRPDPNNRVVGNRVVVSVVRQEFQERAAKGRHAERGEDVRYKQDEREEGMTPGVEGA